MKTLRPYVFILVLLLCLLGYQLTSFALFSNLIRNPGFETYDAETLRPSVWACSNPSDKETGGVFIDKETKWKGEASLRITQNRKDSYNWALQGHRVQKNTRYRLSVYGKVEDIELESPSSQGPRLFVGDAKENGITSMPIQSSEWEQVSLEFNTGEHDYIVVYCYLHKASGTVWFDEVRLEVIE